VNKPTVPANRIWNPGRECLGKNQLADLQLEQLREQLHRVWKHVPYYADKMKQAGLTPDSIRSLDDVRLLPFTLKDDLRQGYPYKTFAVPLKEIVRIHASTGTTGKPTVVGYTRRDMETWTEVVARFLVAGGLTDEDVVQIAFGYGLFTGGFGLHYGVEKVGAAVIPASSGNTDRHLMLIQDFGSTALVCTPTYAVHLGESLQKSGIPAEALKLRLGFFGGEFWTNEIRQKIESLLGLFATDNYGLSEIIGPGVSGECVHQKGMHVQEDHFLFEIVDRDTLQPVKDGELGEVVITTLTKEGIPVIRYRTRDITRVIPEDCPCGRTTRRMEKVTGRTDDMLIIRGVNIFPSQVEEVLMRLQGTAPHYLLIATRDGALDNLEVKVEMSENLFTDQMRKLNAVRDELQHKIDSALGIHAKLTLVEPGSLERFVGKAKRVEDRRTF
jgi:phenylacetate-CoA ligase